MIKTPVLILLVLVSVNLVSCKSKDIAAEHCQIVMQGLDKCVESRVGPLSCDAAVDTIMQSLSLTTITKYNRNMWASECKSLCKGKYQYRPIVRSNYETICTYSEVITVRDERLVKLLALSGLFIVSCIVLVLAMRIVIRRRRFRNSSFKAKGVIVRHETTSSGGSTLYAPVIEFRDWMGRLHTLTSSTYRSTMGKPSRAVDTVVDVYYPKDKPEQARYDSFMTFWFLPFLLFVFGGIFALASGFGLFGSKEWRAHQQYLQQHVPAFAESANTFVHAIRKSVPLVTAIRDYRILDENSDFIMLEADYRVSPLQDGDIYMGAITLTDGHSGGEWAYRPARLSKGYGTAQVRLSMSTGAPDEYCSNEIKLTMYIGGGSRFYERVIPYEKCWSRQ
jgi:hypothetical protein